MREFGLSGFPVSHRNCESRVGAEGNGERGQGEAGEEELSSGLPAAEQPLLPCSRSRLLLPGGGGGRMKSASV